MSPEHSHSPFPHIPGSLTSSWRGGHDRRGAAGGGVFDWRRVLIYTHRWLGIAGCLVFLVWFVSGIVMMYARMPRLTAEERLARLPTLDLTHVAVSPADAARAIGVVPSRVRVGMLADRPVYRFDAAGRWSTVYADSGERLPPLTDDEALALVRRLVPEHAASMRVVDRLDSPDQWTLDGGMPRFLPMHRVALGDAEGTVAYTADGLGDLVMKTNARGRFWGFTGAVLHWTYFTPFRMQREIWRYSIIYAALIGCVMCLSGLAIGIWRFSPSQRFRLKRQPSHSPYAGLMWWHHYAGLIFGLFTFTWALSGALSLTPWDWTPYTDPTETQQAAARGGSLQLGLVDIASLRAVRATLSNERPIKELEILQFQGRPMAMAYRAPSLEEARLVKNPDITAQFSPQLALDHRLAWLDDPSTTFNRLPSAAINRVAAAAMPGVPVRESDWLDSYDAYYYDRYRSKPLPVLRVRYNDSDSTWLYLDPQNGMVSMRQTTRTRVNRWLYNGLHSLDFPFLYYRRPVWDIVLVVLSLGGIGLSMTTMWPAIRRLRRHATRWVNS